MRRTDRGADRGTDFIQTIEIKNKEGKVVDTKEVVTAKGLMHLAHGERLTKIRTRLVQFPTKENSETAIVTARVKTSRGKFSAIGDANPRNVNAKIAPHFIRMAETRAVARALRAALDIGAVAIEELEEELSFVDLKTDERPARETTRTEPRPDAAPRDASDAPRDAASQSNGQRGGSPDGPMTENQRRMLYRIAFEKGHEGDATRTWLHQEFAVDSLSKVTKRQASSFIDKHVQKRDGTNGHAEAG